MFRFATTLLAASLLSTTLGCGDGGANVPPTLTPDQEEQILQEVQGAANSEQGAAQPE